MGDKIISSIIFIVVRLCVFQIEVNRSFNWYKIYVNCYSIGAMCPVGVSGLSFLRVPFPKKSAWQIIFVHFPARWCLDITYVSFYNKRLWVPGNGNPHVTLLVSSHRYQSIVISINIYTEVFLRIRIFLSVRIHKSYSLSNNNLIIIFN